MLADRLTILRFASGGTTFGMSNTDNDVRVGDVMTRNGKQWVIARVEVDETGARIVSVEQGQNP